MDRTTIRTNKCNGLVGKTRDPVVENKRTTTTRNTECKLVITLERTEWNGMEWNGMVWWRSKGVGRSKMWGEEKGGCGRLAF